MSKIKYAMIPFFFLIASPVWATTRYVSTTGSNGNSCAQSVSAATPKLTFNGGTGALACMASGDTLIVRAGTYSEAISTRAGSALPAGTLGAPTTIRNQTGETVWIIPPVASDNNYIDVAYVVFDGINVDNALITPGTPTTNPSSDGWKLAADHITITNAIIKNAAIGILGGGIGHTVTNLEVFGMKDSVAPNNGLTGYGIYVCGSNSLYDHNYIHDNATRGMQQYDGTAITNICSGNVWSNNRFVDTGAGMDICCEDTISIFNNTFSNSGGIFFRNSHGLIANNTFYNTSLALDGVGSGITIQNNIFYMVTTPVNGFGSSITGTCDHNLGTTGGGCAGSTGTNPLFVSATDLHLSSTSSPAYNTGVSLASFFTVDKDGNTRPQGASWDIGAYEFVNGVPVNTPPVEDFNYATSSDANGQSGGTNWASGSTWQSPTAGAFTIEVSPSGSISGGNALKSASTAAVTVSRLFNPVSTGTISWQMRSSVNNSGYRDVGLNDSTGPHLAVIAMKNDGHIHACADYSNDTDLGAYSVDQYYTIQVEFDSTNQANKYRTSVNGGTPSAWINFCQTGTFPSSFAIFKNVAAASDFWVDSIGTTPTNLTGSEIRRSTAQACAATSITLDTGASATTGFYNGTAVALMSGTGAEQFSIITAYNATTKVATISPPWVTNCNSTTSFLIAPRTSGIVLRTNTAAGGATSSVTLDSGASATNSYYSRSGAAILITGGVGAGQTRTIVAYNGSTKVATVNTPWQVQPTSGSTYVLFVR